MVLEESETVFPKNKLPSRRPVHINEDVLMMDLTDNQDLEYGVGVDNNIVNGNHYNSIIITTDYDTEANYDNRNFVVRVNSNDNDPEDILVEEEVTESENFGIVELDDESDYDNRNDVSISNAESERDENEVFLWDDLSEILNEESEKVEQEIEDGNDKEEEVNEAVEN